MWKTASPKSLNVFLGTFVFSAKKIEFNQLRHGGRRYKMAIFIIPKTRPKLTNSCIQDSHLGGDPKGSVGVLWVFIGLSVKIDVDLGI